MNRIPAWALALLFPLLLEEASAATLEGRVVSIADGDKIAVLDATKQQHRIRINGIDAPEKDQAFGERSKKNLSRMAFQKDARLECHKTDRYKRKVCKVWVQPSDCPACGKTLDVGRAQAIAGLAWWYRAYAKEQTAEDQSRYESAEDEARLRKWGLWQEKEPVPPWEWRRQSKKCLFKCSSSDLI
jgi:endonuclease YncB( thermonuclease family)